MKTAMYKNVLFDFFDGKASSIQRRLIEEWLQSAENESFFYECLDEWERLHPQYVPNKEAALNDYARLLTATPDRQEPAHPPELTIRRSWFSPLWLAASILLLAIAGGVLFQKVLLYQTYQTGNAQTQQVKLADGTRVTLNANSTLAVPRWNVIDPVRTVYLTGEGEFNVSHTADHKLFRVRTDGDFAVNVLGTEFVLFARERGRKVVLNHGKVELTYQAGKRLIMKPGDVATLSDKSGQIELARTTKPERYSSWKKHQFYFDQTPLSEVALVLHEHFGLTVILEDSTLADRRLAGYFTARNAQEIIDVLTPLLDVTIEKRANTVFIRSN